MRACDLFVLSSRWEGMPNVVLEAMAAGLPVVATDVEGVRDVLVDGETGVLAKRESAESLSRKLSWLLNAAPAGPHWSVCPAAGSRSL